MLFYSITIFLFGFIVSYQVNLIQGKHLESTAIQQLTVISDLVKPIILNQSDEVFFDLLVSDFQSSPTDLTYLVFDQNREFIASNNPSFDNPDVSDISSELDISLGGGSSSNLRAIGDDYQEKLVVALPIKQSEQIIGSLLAILPTESVSALSKLIRIVTIFLIFLGSAVILITSEYLSRRTFRPIREMTQTAQKIGKKSLNFSSDTNLDEISELVIAFNAMSIEVSSQIDALRAESTKLETILQQMTDGVIIADKNGRVQLSNQSAERLFLTSESNLVGHSLVEALRDYRLIDLWEKCVQTVEEQSIYLEFRQPNRILHCIATPMGDNLKDSVLLLFQDLTRIRQLETVRRDFISNISHELRTPLASLKALAETLSDGALEDPPAARKFLNRMETEVDALSQLVSELLELARIESGKVPLQFSSVHPFDLLQSAYDRLHVQAERKNVKVQIECDDHLPNILADKVRMEQVIVNLFQNSIKFTPEGGEIILGAFEETKEIIFYVKDTGVGIPSEEIPRIFERFYKADRARSSGGTGLGLAISRHIIEAHGGKIWAESAESLGSTFYFSLLKS